MMTLRPFSLQEICDILQLYVGGYYTLDQFLKDFLPRAAIRLHDDKEVEGLINEIEKAWMTYRDTSLGIGEEVLRRHYHMLLEKTHDRAVYRPYMQELETIYPHVFKIRSTEGMST